MFAPLLSATRGLLPTFPVSLSLSLFLSSCHYKTWYWTFTNNYTNNLYQPLPLNLHINRTTKLDLITYINQNEKSQSYAQYHLDVHQPSIDHVPYHVPYHVPIMHINHVHNNYTKITKTCTNHVSTTNQIMPHKDTPTPPYHEPYACANSSTICSNMSLNHIPKTYTNITLEGSLEIHHTIHNQIP